MVTQSKSNFAEEREQARLEAERLTTALQAHGYKVGPVDWERAGRLAYVPVNGVEIDSLITLAGYEQSNVLLEQVRLTLLEAAAREHLQEKARAVSWAPLEIPANAPSEMQSLWRIHLGEDEQPGVNIAEVLRNGWRSYEYYPGGPQFGVHTFHVDTISPRAMHAIRAAGGSVIYQPEAQRADDVQGRRQVTLPEHTHQYAESDAQMAPQRFRLPDGTELRLVPAWYTVALYVADEEERSTR